MNSRIPTATILAAFAAQEQDRVQDFENLAARFSEIIAKPAAACALDAPGRPVLRAITSLLQQGIVKIAILPLFISPAENLDISMPARGRICRRPLATGPIPSQQAT